MHLKMFEGGLQAMRTIHDTHLLTSKIYTIMLMLTFTFSIQTTS